MCLIKSENYTILISSIDAIFKIKTLVRGNYHFAIKILYKSGNNSE